MFQIHYCEFNRSNSDCDRIYRPQGSGDYLFLLLKTPMKFHLDKKLVISRENACILYTPGVCQDYQAVRKFRNSYMHFLTDLRLEEQYRIPVNQLFYPAGVSALDDLLQEIQKEYLGKEPYYQDRIRLLTESLFLLAARGLTPPSSAAVQDASLLQSFQALRLRMLGSCQEDWSARRLCALCSMGKSQFYHYYREFFHTTPKEDLLAARMDKARTLLTTQALQVQQVAKLCGFPSVQHFTRYFREQFGCSPREYQYGRKITEKNTEKNL